MSNFIFNLRVWMFHLQITTEFRVTPIIRWFDCWIGLYFDEENVRTYLFLLPMIGLKFEGICIKKNQGYRFTRDPLVWLFTFGSHYFPMERNQYE